jgi:hypothetical protein
MLRSGYATNDGWSNVAIDGREDKAPENEKEHDSQTEDRALVACEPPGSGA